MHSRRVLGAIALGAIVVAAISFAIVDSSIATADACADAGGSCKSTGVPVIAITFSALGALALLVSVIPAVTWIVEEIQLHHHAPEQIDLELARRHRPRRVPMDDF